ncbi:hypothetical protein [Botrimarina sp.]|uniref:hypothetical protein n=1 Tax=Botrimarina sp. TaxID=2795802 RepID=UPI0032F06929
MNGDDSWGDAFDEDPDGDPDADLLPCPDCGAAIDADSEACPDCGYWITEADRAEAWRAGSATGRVLRVGWWIIGLAVAGALVAWWR